MINGYDAITRETRPLGGYTIYAYNTDGTIATTSTYSASGILLDRKSTTYNLAGKVLQESHVPESSSMSGALTTTYGYDSENHLIRETDPKGNTTISDYTPFGEVGSITDPMGNKKEFTYDANGNITLEKTLPSTGTGITTITRTYDRENRLLEETDTLGHTVHHTYDAR